MPIEVKKTKIFARVQDPKKFQKGSFRTIKLKSGVNAIIGKKIGKQTTEIQALRIDKKKGIKYAKKEVAKIRKKLKGKKI